VGGDGLPSSLSAPETRAFVAKFIQKLKHQDTLTLLGGFFASIYNSAVEDSSHEIQSELPILPVSAVSAGAGGGVSGGNSASAGAAAGSVNEDAVLAVLAKIAINGRDLLDSRLQAPWLRVLGEIHYAQANYAVAMRHYVQSILLTTNYFTSPWVSGAGLMGVGPLPPPQQAWDERMFYKMIKCTSELGHHATTVVLCQFVSDTDYPTAFRSLEDRSSNDAMDAMYQFMWDVTALEYAVSMHTKRGELSRKKKALDTIGQLEINTNNNEEILREARTSRRSAFMRYLASLFI